MSALVEGLQAQPIFAIGATVGVYWLSMALWQRSGRAAPLHPVLVATALLAALLWAIGMDYRVYFGQALLLNEALGLVVVLLAVPLYRQFRLIGTAGRALACALVAGSLIAVATALVPPVATGTTAELLATLAPKSATAAVAVQVADKLGGIGGLTAVVVISTGIFGAVFGPALLHSLGVEDERAAGFALGVASHAIGTARAFQISEVAGAFASLGMILNALLTIALVPAALVLVG